MLLLGFAGHMGGRRHRSALQGTAAAKSWLAGVREPQNEGCYLVSRGWRKPPLIKTSTLNWIQPNWPFWVEWDLAFIEEEDSSWDHLLHNLKAFRVSKFCSLQIIITHTCAHTYLKHVYMFPKLIRSPIMPSKVLTKLTKHWTYISFDSLYLLILRFRWILQVALRCQHPDGYLDG